MGTKGKDWAWGALGIARTSDKDAIRAAYDAKRAELDAQAMRISAFAELTEAREKALFIASELLREEQRVEEQGIEEQGGQEQRGGVTGKEVVEAAPDTEPVEELAAPQAPPMEVPPVDPPTSDPAPVDASPPDAMPAEVPPAPQEVPAEPEREAEAEDKYKGPWEHAGGYQPAFDTTDEHHPWVEPVEPGLDPDPDEEWSHAGSYTPEVEHTVDPEQLFPAPSALEEASEVDKRTRAAVRNFFERYPIKTYWVVYGIAAFFLLRSCS